LLLDPHVCADDTAVKEGCTAANLGGTAEAVFRPMGEKDSFLLFFRVFPTAQVFFMNQKGDSDGYKNIVQIAETEPAQSD